MNPTRHDSSTRSLLRNFFFAEEVPFGLALTRIFLPLSAATPMVLRFPRVRQLFSTDGSPVQLFELYGQGEVLPVFSPTVAASLYGVMLLAFFCSIIGFRTRLSLIITVVLYAYFNLLDAVGTVTKYSSIATHVLLLLSVSNCGAVWSVDSWLRKKSDGFSSPLPPRTSVWPMRLIQLLFASIYFGAAITKIQTAEFFSGDQMRYWMLSNWNYENPVGEVMAMWSPLLLVSAYLAVIWEIMFAFLVWQPRTRLPMLAIGATFHFMTWLTLGLYIFPAICLSTYFAFLTEADVVRFRQFAVRWRLNRFLGWPVAVGSRVLQQLPQLVPAPVAWVSLLALGGIVATEVEVQLDLYGSNSDAGNMILQPMDSIVARTMIQKEQRVRQQDKFFSFEIGTSTIGEQLANRQQTYEYGEVLIAQCNMNPPHEDMWVECTLEDTENRVIEKFGQFVTREMLRANFTYRFGNKLLPGNYSMVLKNAGAEIYRRDLELVGTPPVDMATLQALTN